MGYNYSEQESTVQFYVPPTLPGDFDNFLAMDIPGAVMNFELIHDWYKREKPDYEPIIIRGEIYPDKSKSRYANTDNNINFRTSVKNDIHKGDILIDDNESVYVLDWDIPPQPNNKMSRSLRCNVMLTFTRFSETEYDENGFRIENDEDRQIIVAPHIPVNAYRYDGRPEFSAISATPGVTPNALSIISVQYNELTNNIRPGDNFIWANDIYSVVDISYEGMNIKGDHGVLRIQAKKEPGGDL